MEAKMKNVRALSEALAQVEELIGKMGGSMGYNMKIYQAGTVILVKSALCFDLEKLNEYTAQFPRIGWVDLSSSPDKSGKELSMDGVSETFKA
jgi:hypothetical protein